MKLYYGNILLGEVLTNHSMTVDEALEHVGINMDKYAQKMDGMIGIGKN